MTILRHVSTALKALIFLMCCNAIATETSNIPQKTVLTLATAPITNGSLNKKSSTPVKVSSILNCIFDKLNVNTNIKTIPWKRARRELEDGHIDGIFLTSASDSQIGLPTHPVYLEKWHAFSISKTNLAEPSLYRVGVISGSDEETWLSEQGALVHIQARSFEQLLAQFKANRFDIFIADKSLAENFFNKRYSNLPLRQSFVRYSPKRVTFSHQYVRENPDFVEQFNRQITNCNKEVVKLDNEERVRVISFATETILPHINSTVKLDIVKLLTSSGLTQSEIQDIDSQWKKAAALKRQSAHASIMLKNPVSSILRNIREEYSLLREIILTDIHGQLIAASDLTSDFWQGDETKVQALKNNELYLSEITYDESSSHFICHFSTKINLSAQTDGLQAILIIGVALEELLLDEEQMALQYHFLGTAFL